MFCVQSPQDDDVMGACSSSFDEYSWAEREKLTTSRISLQGDVGSRPFFLDRTQRRAGNLHW